MARSSPGDEPNGRTERPKVPEQPSANVLPPAKQPRPFIERAPAPVQQPITIVHHYPATTQLPEVEKPRSEVQRKPEVLTPVKEKELTPVNQTTPEKINEKLTKQPQSVNFSETRPLNFSGPKLPKKLKFKGKPGRQRTNEQVVELLTFVQTRGAWPHGVSDQMQRYYRREYPEYFRKGRKKGSTGKVHAVRPAPINISARRVGSGN